MKAIEHDPARRYQDADDLADDLERFLADRPIRARPVGQLSAWKWARRKPAIAGLLAALALALVVGFAGITWQWREAVAARDASRVNESEAPRQFPPRPRDRRHVLHAGQRGSNCSTSRGCSRCAGGSSGSPWQYYQSFQRAAG